MTDLKARQLNLLIELTEIRSEAIERALHLCLLEGKTQEEAAKIVGVSQAIISKRLKVIKEKDALVRKLTTCLFVERLLPLVDAQLLTEILEQR